MRFRGLPVDLHVAESDLTPVTPCVLLLPCANCNYVNPSFLVCLKNHIICRPCSVQSTSSASSAWCPMCRQVVTVTAVTIDRDMLAQLRFRCRCGLERTLPDLRMHVLEKGVHELPAGKVSSPDLPTGSAQPEMVESRLRAIAVEEFKRLKHELEHPEKAEDEKHGLLQKIEADRTEILQKTEEDKKELLQVIEKASVGAKSAVNVEHLQETVNALKDDIENLKHCRPATAQRAYFWFDFDDLSKRFQNAHDGVKSELQHSFIGGIPFQACIKLWSVDKKEYLDICGGRADHHEIDIPLPLNRKVVLTIHDTNGKVFATKSCNSYISGQYLFRFGSKEAGLSRTTKLIEVSLLTKNCLINGKMLTSIELQPMDS
ncbi:uncharacterized protein LOC111269109 isoform X2 [Varroa jacobsoni]|nr:uncharacterized protein LOC111251068 isoform X2 [Varroa destructor]XP_022663047.1 uncharacterized protein LOC111251068 isoform X2 [Varroa destructor]XP_022663048.1 uncharacterized protein LOC111251068 isoform X2 [Varroa destructor]XP_022663049.1 uncharacterized protein LOC111251068 isoform X2 [Varroa destructor]XP_022704213.1 uncharacterized protein LOC111269109 isoform X2 [Varroa jacobsoni]XP_022704214.1 uncharacterized protein LOC111269109 isoform X2 [Varroa jacobsoni]